MTKKELEELLALTQEIRIIGSEIAHLEPEFVADIVKDYRSGYGRAVKITGYTYNQGKENRLQKLLEVKRAVLEEQAIAMEYYLDTLPDSEMRTILRMYYRQGMTQRQIGEELGYERATIAKKLERFFSG